MILFDTDHVTVLGFPDGNVHKVLSDRINVAADERFAIPIVCAEEQMRGWLDQIARSKTVQQQVRPYGKLVQLFEFFARWQLLPFSDRAANIFTDLRRRKVRIGTMDLKIAAIALAQGALLLSANLRDFRKVPGLRLDSWLRP